MKNPARKTSTGDPAAALDIARRAAAEVPAYARLLEKAGLLQSLLAGTCALGDLPLTDKGSYCLASGREELTPRSLRAGINGFFMSSGSSGSPFCWPRLKAPPHSISLPAWLEGTYGIKGRPTLAVVALSMDGWNAGLNTALALNQFSLEAPFPFMAAFPGSDYAQAVRLIAEAGDLAELVIVFIYPAAIPYFLRLAEELGSPLPLHKLRFAATGDPFRESLREELDTLCGASWPDTALASYSYSSADTRIIGSEHRASRALARLLHKSPGLRRAFALGEDIPNLYVTVPPAELPLTEEVGGELVFTRWQPVPIIRYNLGDKGEIWDWAQTRRIVMSAQLPPDLEPLRAELSRLEEAPGDIIALYGRSRGLFFYGMHLDEAALEKAVRGPELAKFRPGLFEVELEGGPVAPRLAWNIEVADTSAPGLEQAFYRAFTDSFSSSYPHFGVNYRNFLHKWDGDPQKSVFRFSFLPYPALSDRLKGSRKHRIIKPGPARPG